MTATTFDTLKFANRLKQSGLAPEQAEAIAEAHREALSEALDSALATKSDVADLKTELKTDISDVKGDIKLVKWMLGFLVAGVAGILMKLFS